LKTDSGELSHLLEQAECHLKKTAEGRCTCSATLRRQLKGGARARTTDS
jgi:hypothetical protein